MKRLSLSLPLSLSLLLLPSLLLAQFNTNTPGVINLGGSYSTNHPGVSQPNPDPLPKTGSYYGTFVGNGGGLTNTLGTDPRSWGAVGNGVANDTAAIQAMINAGVSPYLGNGTYAVTNLFLSNNVAIRGCGGVLKAIGSTGYVLRCPVPSKGIVLEDFTVQGPGYTLPATADLAPFLFGSIQDYCGVLLDIGGTGCEARNVHVDGFSGYGWTFTSTNTPGTAPQSPRTSLAGLRASDCGCGFCADTGNTSVSEYMVVSGLAAWNCAKAFVAYAGNIRLVNCNFTGNLVGVSVISAGVNPAHGQVSDCTINHTDVPIYCLGALQDNGGFAFRNNLMYAAKTGAATMSLKIISSSGVVIENNSISCTTLILTNSAGASIFRNNTIYGSGSAYNVTLQDPGGGMRVFGNFGFGVSGGTVGTDGTISATTLKPL